MDTLNRICGRFHLHAPTTIPLNLVGFKHISDSQKGRNSQGQTRRNGVEGTHHGVRLHSRQGPRCQGLLLMVFKIRPRMGRRGKHGHAGPTCKPADEGLGSTIPTDAESPERAGSGNTPGTQGNSGRKLFTATGLGESLGTGKPALTA